MHKPPSTPVPIFKLYGEDLDWSTPDLLHCETIPKRSRVFHWEIRPHRHADLCQMLYLHKGQADIEIEGQRRSVRQATLQFVPPLCVHGFRFSENVDGFVVTLAAPLLSQVQAQAGLRKDMLTAPGTYPAGHDRAYLHALFSALQNEYQGQQAGRELMLHSLINVALVWLSRQALQRDASGQAPERGREYLTRFTQLVESEFRKQPSVEQMAHQVGVSAAHLNTLCRQLAGSTALQIVHQRLLLEAKRNLIYTAMTVNQISDSLGFADPAYFARFFKRLTGLPPKVFREQGL